MPPGAERGGPGCYALVDEELRIRCPVQGEAVGGAVPIRDSSTALLLHPDGDACAASAARQPTLGQHASTRARCNLSSCRRDAGDVLDSSGAAGRVVATHGLMLAALGAS